MALRQVTRRSRPVRHRDRNTRYPARLEGVQEAREETSLESRPTRRVTGRHRHSGRSVGGHRTRRSAVGCRARPGRAHIALGAPLRVRSEAGVSRHHQRSAPPGLGYQLSPVEGPLCSDTSPSGGTVRCSIAGTGPTRTTGNGPLTHSARDRLCTATTAPHVPRVVDPAKSLGVWTRRPSAASG